jgi:hypothetical protein
MEKSKVQKMFQLSRQTRALFTEKPLVDKGQTFSGNIGSVLFKSPMCSQVPKENSHINPMCSYVFFRALDNFSTEEYVTSSVLGQGVFDSPS